MKSPTLLMGYLSMEMRPPRWSVSIGLLQGYQEYVTWPGNSKQLISVSCSPANSVC